MVRIIAMADKHIFALATMVLGGIWVVLVKIASQTLSPRSIFIIQVIGSLIAGFIVLISLNFKPEFHGKGIFFSTLATIVGSLSGLFFLYAISKDKISVIAPLTALSPVITILLAYFFLKEPITLKEGIGMLLAILAIVLLSA